MDPTPKETKVPTSEKTISDEDQLAALGHVQELRREFLLVGLLMGDISGINSGVVYSRTGQDILPRSICTS
jgi:hypothetical protein